MRRSQTANGVQTRYAVDVAAGLPQVLQETRSGATTRYLYGLDQLATQDSGTWAYHHPDGLGSVRQMSDASGQVVMARSYTPFGAVKSESGTASGSFGYAGEQQDAASGLTFLRARYYDPNTGRFLTRDPYPSYASVPSTLHRYVYAANNPVNLTDPSGLMPNILTNLSGNGGSWSPVQPSASQYNMTGRADGLRSVVNTANQLSRALSQGARSPECGPTGVLGDWWQSLQRGTLGPDLLRWGLNEYRTNPLWQRQFTDATGSGVAATTYHVDGGNWLTYTAPFSVTGDLIHAAEYHSTDYAGNVEVTRTLAAKIDAHAPQVTGLTASPEVFSPNNDGRRDTTAISATVADVYLQSWTLDILSGTQVVSNSLGTTSTISLTWDGSGQMGDGVYTLWLTATDQAGNAGGASSVAQVDTSAPTIDVTAPPAGAVISTNVVLVAGQVTTDATSLAVTIIPESGSTQTLSLTIQPGGIFSQTVDELWPGVNTLNFAAQDIGGNQAIVTRTVTWNDVLPAATVIHYTYDSLQRLTQASYSTGEVYTYTYDATGNRLAENSPAGFRTYVYDAADQLTSVNGQAYTWDDNGNLLDDGQRAFTYNNANQLTQVVSGTLTTQYAYSGDGVRRSQTANGVETRYAVDVAAGLPQVLQETRGSNTTRYLYGLDQLATQDSGTPALSGVEGWAYHHPDGLGSVRQMSDSAGQVVMARSYTPFGAVKSESGTASGSFGYAGEQGDAASDLVFLRARYYDPSTGHFLTRDPYPAYATVPSTLHRYAYAANNPVNLTDPSGLMPNLPTATFGNGGLLYPPQPGAPQYDLTGQADGLRGLVDAANQLSRQLSQGARSPECGSTGVLGDFWQSLQRGTLGPDLVRWGLNEYRTNPLWQRQFTDAELRQLTIDLAKRGEFEITRLLRQIVDEKGLQHWLTGQVDYAVQALRDPRTAIVMGFNLGVGLVATGIGAATLPAIAAVAVGSLVANVAFQTWVESGGGLNFNLEAFRSSLGINSAATVPGLIGGMIGARFGPWGRYIGAAIGSGLSQILTNKLMGRDWDEGLLLNMGLSVGMEGVMAGVEHVAGRLENLNFGQKLREWGFADERLYAVEPSSRRLFELFAKSGDEPRQGGLAAAESERSSLEFLQDKRWTGDALSDFAEIAHPLDVAAEPHYLGFDPTYGHRWSDGGYTYGRMSPQMVETLKGLAKHYDRNIVIVGGWAETELGVNNRIRALAEYGEEVEAPRYGVPDWRNTGAPTSGLPGADPDFDYWTRRGRTDLPDSLKSDLARLFGVHKMDNYNKFPSGALTVPPSGAITFHARTERVTRRLAPWQKPPRW